MEHGDERDADGTDGRADEGDEVGDRDEHRERHRIGDTPGLQPDEARQAGDDRGGEVAEDVTADPVEDLVAEQADARTPRSRHRAVQHRLHRRHVGQEVDGQDDDRQR